MFIEMMLIQGAALSAKDNEDPDEAASPETSPDGRLFAAHYPDLWRFAAVVSRAGLDPDDLVQDAVERALRRGPLTRLDDPGAYLRRSIVNLASNERRRLGRHSRALTLVGATSSQSDHYSFELEALARLKPADRALLWLVDIEGWDSASASRIVGCTPDAARTRASRARRTLRRHVEETE